MTFMKKIPENIMPVTPHLPALEVFNRGMRNPDIFFKKRDWIPASAGMTKLGLLIVVVMMLLNGTLSHASETPIWVEADGQAVMGEVETQKEVKERAKIDAQSKAVEKAVGVFIKSHTLVSNSQLAEDLVYASVRGKIKKIETIKEGWDEKDRNLYRVKIKAFVEPVYPEKGAGLSLKAALSKNVLKEGEDVKIFYQASRDCYVYIFSVAVDGSVTLLLPNSINRDNFIKSKTAYEFPASESGIKLKAMLLSNFKGKAAEEKIKIIATSNKEEIIPLGFQEGMFKAYDAKSTGMVSDLVRKLNQLEPAEWTEATVSYRIER